MVLKRRDDLGHESTFRLYANAVVNLMRVHELIMNFTVVVVPKLSSRSLIANARARLISSISNAIFSGSSAGARLFNVQ